MFLHFFVEFIHRADMAQRLHVQGMQTEIVTMDTRWGTGSAIGFLSEIVLYLFARNGVLGYVMGIFVHVVYQPVNKSTDGSIRVLYTQGKALGALWYIFPVQLGIDVLTTA